MASLTGGILLLAHAVSLPAICVDGLLFPSWVAELLEDVVGLEWERFERVHGMDWPLLQLAAPAAFVCVCLTIHLARFGFLQTSPRYRWRGARCR